MQGTIIGPYRWFPEKSLLDDDSEDYLAGQQLRHPAFWGPLVVQASSCSSSMQHQHFLLQFFAYQDVERGNFAVASFPIFASRVRENLRMTSASASGDAASCIFSPMTISCNKMEADVPLNVALRRRYF